MRAVIVDDHPLYLDAACRQILRAFRKAVIRSFVSLDEAVASLSIEPADVVLFDYSLGKIEGLRQLIAVCGDAPLIVMSGVASATDVAACISAGARGFLPKTMEGKVFINAVSLVLNGGTYAPVEFAGRGQAAPSAEEDGTTDVVFSVRERDLLQLIAMGAPNKEIARSLGLQEVTVKFYLTHLFRKLGVKNRSQAAVTAIRLGYGQPN
jgi:two-component system, NarL family, nitrate/nitrite response regulator NarL